MFGRNLLGRFTSLESDMPEDDLEIESPEEGTDETGAQLDGENIVEGDLVEAAEDEAEINEADDEAEELEDTSESLESFLMAAQLGKAQGGWTEGEALAYGLGLDATLKRLGGSSSGSLDAPHRSGEYQTRRRHRTHGVDRRSPSPICLLCGFRILSGNCRTSCSNR